MQHFYALIMAGGGGTRLWPLSRRERPKQALSLTEERTMFQITVERLDGLFAPEHIFCITNRQLADLLHSSTPQLPKENFIVEPSGRDSGPAALYGSAVIAAQDPEAVIAVLSADHHIAKPEQFLGSLRCAYEAASKNQIVTLGIQPTYAATGFGYIQRGAPLETHGEHTVYKALGFHEKPNEALAAEYIKEGTYGWNAGIFIWSAKRILQEYAQQQPEMVTTLRRIMADPFQIAELWAQMQKISLDYAIMEKAANVSVIPVDIGWSDIGTWASLFDVLDRDEHGNAIRSTLPDHIQIKTKNTLIVSDRMVVTLGVDDLVIVDTEDALLVCHRDHAQDVKKVVDQLKEAKKDHMV